MTDLKSIPVANFQGLDLSLHNFLHLMKVKGLLRPMLREVIADAVISAAAEKKGITVSQDELQNAADNFRRRQRLNKADTTRRWLAANNLNEEDLEVGLRRKLVQQKFVNQITNGNGAVEKHFAENRTRFDRARISRIVVKDEGLANEIASQINEEGVNFAEQAAKHSIDRRIRNVRGGVAARNRLPEAIAQAVFNAKPGEVVGPFPVGDTFHVLKVHSVRLGELNGRTKAVIRRQIFRRWLSEQMKQAKIEVKLPENL